jgi:hypothetical protein
LHNTPKDLSRLKIKLAYYGAISWRNTFSTQQPLSASAHPGTTYALNNAAKEESEVLVSRPCSTAEYQKLL